MQETNPNPKLRCNTRQRQKCPFSISSIEAGPDHEFFNNLLARSRFPCRSPFQEDWRIWRGCRASGSSELMSHFGETREQVALDQFGLSWPASKKFHLMKDGMPPGKSATRITKTLSCFVDSKIWGKSSHKVRQRRTFRNHGPQIQALAGLSFAD